MPSLRDTVIDDDVRQALEGSGYYSEGFEGDTLGGYQDWYKGAFGLDPFSTATSLSGPTGVPDSVDNASEWINRNPMNFDPDIGYTGNPASLSNQQLGVLQQTEEKRAIRKEEDAQQRGTAMMNWLMGISTKISGADFSKVAPVGMAKAQSDLGYDAQVADYSGLLGIRSSDAMAAERAKAAEFDFTRDLLPSLISVGGLFQPKAKG